MVQPALERLSLVTQAIREASKIYASLNPTEALPLPIQTVFNIVMDRSGLALDTLATIEGQTDEGVDSSFNSNIEDCLVKATSLQQVLDMCIKTTTSTTYAHYVKSIVQGQHVKIEELMIGILEGVQRLAELVGGASAEQVQSLQEAIKTVLAAGSSVPEEKDGQRTHVYTHYGSGSQNLHSGKGNQSINNGPGRMYVGNTQNFQEVHDVQASKSTLIDTEKCLRTLYTCPYADRKDRNIERVKGTCGWFTSHQRFKTWKDFGTILWVTADPGCGKSVLAKYLVDKVLPGYSLGYLCYFFFKDDFSDQQSSASAICALIRQLLIQRRDLLDEDVKLRMAEDGKKFIQSFKSLWTLFVALARKAGRVVCVLDALDECCLEDRAMLIKSIIDLSRTPNGVKFLMTSRPYSHIQQEFRVLEKQMPTIRLKGEGDKEVEQISQEINLVVRSRVQELGKRLDLTLDEEEFLQFELGKGPNRTYLWLHLVLDVIQQTPGFSRGKVRRSIGQIPETVGAAYDKILNRSSDHKKARQLLSLILAAVRPLSVGEVNVALAIDGSHRTCKDLEDELETEERFRITVRDLCGLFVVIVDQRLYLLHQTAREFLVLADTGDIVAETKFLSWKGSFKLADTHRFLGQACLWYLSLQDIESASSNPSLLDYATDYWPAHVREADLGWTDELTRLALDACRPNSKKLRIYLD